MANLASALKAEIARVARKEIRAEIESLKKASVNHRTDISALKRRCQALEQELKNIARATRKNPSEVAPVEGETPSRKVRFSSKGLAIQRRRLGLSAHECGLLVGASGQSIYNWEAGSARPRASHLEAIASLRSMGKKQAAARLLELQTTPA
jgi:DNA-binding transcriptional regulator YiaG